MALFSKDASVLQGTIELLVLITGGAKFYRLTRAGEREFEEQANGWVRLSDAVSRAVSGGARR